jgi:hypothetical protein
MYMLARVCQALAERKPDLDAGAYAYAKAGFGDYSGFFVSAHPLAAEQPAQPASRSHGSH